MPSTIYFNELSASDDLERAELFNKYFHSVYTSSPFTLPLLNDLPTPDTLLTNINISSYDVFQVLCTLDPPRPLELTISPVIFRSCAGSFTNLVYHLLSLSLRSQKILLEWRTHTVIPVFKSGDKSSVTNHRPISLLCIISKVLEKLVYQ